MLPVYQPTGSKLKFTDKYYGPALRSQLEELFTLSEAALVKRAADAKWQEKVNLKDKRVTDAPRLSCFLHPCHRRWQSCQTD
ncbi:MAG: hypothetical protein IJ814_02875 [Paludibacteraceae bacterium]|nr:hypothetical protein [Paludibacteraceae bacterium]